MGRIWAVARHTVAESIRMKIAVLFIAVILGLLIVIPLFVEGDGLTVKSRVQSALAYSLGVVSFLLSMLTVFMACASLANEIQLKQILMVVSKPIPRWQILAGKWLGIGVINAGILTLTWLTVWGFTAYLSTRPSPVPTDRKALEEEVLTVRHGLKPTAPDFAASVNARIRQLQEEGRLEEVTAADLPAVRERISRELKDSWRRLRPGEYQDYRFEGLRVDRQADGYVLIHIKPTCPTTGADDVRFHAGIEAGDPAQKDTLVPAGTGEYIVGRAHVIPIPNQAVNREGVLHLRLYNLGERDTIAFEGDDSLEALYGFGTFHWNLFRALALIWCRLAFLAVAGLAASTFLSFPVGCTACLLVMLVASSSGFLTDAIQQATPQPNQPDPYWFIGPVLRPLAGAFIWLVPDFSKYDAIGNVVSGRIVPLMWVIHSIVVFILLKGLIVGGLGCLVLTRRELAQPSG